VAAPNAQRDPPAPEGSWTIERLVAGGEGLARLGDGRVGLAAGVASGDEIEALAVEHRRGILRASAWRLLVPGPGRVAPPCRWADRCGGCDWMHLGREAQLEGKRAIVVDALERIAGLRGRIEVPPVRTAGSPWRYRTRLRLHVDRQGRVGLYGRASREIVEIDDCPVSAEPIRDAMALLRAALAEAPREGPAPFDAEIRVAPAGPPTVVLLLASARHGPSPALVGHLQRRLPLRVAAGPASVGDEQRYPLPGAVELWAAANAFTQVNWAVNVELVQAVLARAVASGLGRFFDLYCGAGNFALPLLAAGMSGIAIDQSTDAVDGARRAARAQGLERGRFESGDVPALVRRLARRGERCDLAVIDPPRAGARELAPLVAAVGPRACALCACDPATAARDIASLVKLGYRLEAVEPFDMFPQTHHVELLAWLERGSRRGQARRTSNTLR
jgi:23S rRNA (uracil1939-C5)-methyltransferase